MTRMSLISVVKDCDTHQAKRILLEDHYDNVDAEDSVGGGTALFWACSNGLVEIVRILLKRNADTEACTAWKATPLHASADNNHLHIARMLINHRANVNCRTVYGDSPCHLAAYRGYGDMVKLLVESGNADLSITNCKNRTPLDESIITKHDDISRYIHNAMILKKCHPKRLVDLRVTDVPLDLSTIPASNTTSMEHSPRFQFSDEDNDREEDTYTIHVNNNNSSMGKTAHYAVPSLYCDSQIINRFTSSPPAGRISNVNRYCNSNAHPYIIQNSSHSSQLRSASQINHHFLENIEGNVSISDSNTNSMLMNDLSASSSVANQSQLSFLNISLFRGDNDHFMLSPH
ncbi:ankyrin repeat, PH and SEC7 domain containing protein secG-like [Argonauta hians]